MESKSRLSMGDNTLQGDGRRHMDLFHPQLLMVQDTGSTLHQCQYQPALPFIHKDKLVTRYYQIAEENKTKQNKKKRKIKKRIANSYWLLTVGLVF